jgi:hypothetical protein
VNNTGVGAENGVREDAHEAERICGGILSRPLPANYPEFPDSCLPQLLAVLINVAQAIADREHVHLEQHTHELLRQPHRIILHPHLDPLLARLLGEDEKLRRAVADAQGGLAHRGVSPPNNGRASGP